MPERKKHALSYGRPPRFDVPKAAISSKVTRNIIRTHHNLQKAYAQAVKDGDNTKANEIEDKIKNQGGLKVYQQASIVGQSSSRGGDSSKVLMQWLGEEGVKEQAGKKYEMLEVGTLSAMNACSRSGLFNVTRIDLNSQDPRIEQQDFMERPLPDSDGDLFDIISLSLVLNYVPDAEGRGEMLRRTRQFLRTYDDEEEHVFPALFLVLPAPCVTNSRYMTEHHLDVIMNSLGYEKLKQKISAKLVYSVWSYEEASSKRQQFSKKEINPGRGRNNFSIVLR